MQLNTTVELYILSKNIINTLSDYYGTSMLAQLLEVQ